MLFPHGGGQPWTKTFHPLDQSVFAEGIYDQQQETDSFASLYVVKLRTASTFVSHIIVDMMTEEESPSIQQLQMELHLMTLKVDKLTKENVDLKQHIKITVGNDSKLRHNYEAQSIEKDRLSKLVDQLKNEKKSLVETVLQLSNEVDAMHKTSDHFESDQTQRLVHAEMMINAARRRLGLQIIDALGMHQIGNDHPLMKVCLLNPSVIQRESMCISATV